MNWGVITFPGSNDDVQAAYVSATRLFVAKRPFWVVPEAR